MLNSGVPQSNYDQQKLACTSLYFFIAVPPFASLSELPPSHSDSRKRARDNRRKAKLYDVLQ